MGLKWIFGIKLSQQALHSHTLTAWCSLSSPSKTSETSNSASFCWFASQQSCRFELASWHGWIHRNWFHLAVGSPWQRGSLIWPHPLIDLLGFSILFPSFSLISTGILLDQLWCPGTWARLHWECTNCFFHLDVLTTSFLKVAVTMIQSGSVC